MHSPKEEPVQATKATFVVDAAALRSALDVHVQQHVTQRAAADALGISSVYLSDVLNDRRDIAALADRLGYRSLTLYVPVDGEPMPADLAARLIEEMKRHSMATRADAAREGGAA